MKHEVKLQGRQVSFLIEDKRKDSYLDLMKKKIDSEEGKRLYSRRMWVIEPVFGNICANKRLNRLSLRGTANLSRRNQSHGPPRVAFHRNRKMNG